MEFYEIIILIAIITLGIYTIVDRICKSIDTRSMTIGYSMTINSNSKQGEKADEVSIEKSNL